MARPKSRISAIVSLILLGALVSAIIRFAYVAYIIAQAGESLISVPFERLLIDVMGLHRFALYGAGGGAILGITLLLVDLLRYNGRAEDHSWKNSEELNPFARDLVKAHRMETGNRYSKDHPLDGHGDDTK